MSRSRSWRSRTSALPKIPLLSATRGGSVDEYRAPLFLAWQLTNRCTARCIACCEESGPDKAWRDELSRPEALDLGRRVVEAGIPYAAFGGGEPLGVPYCWELFELLARGGVSIKLETDGSRIDDQAADRLVSLAVQCVQISVDGATAATHERVRPGSSFAAATAAIERLVLRGCAPQLVFVPNRFNIHEICAAYDLATALGCAAFVTGPMMRIGRAAARWNDIACGDDEWQRAADALRGARRVAQRTRRAVDLSVGHRHGDGATTGKSAGDAVGRPQRQGQASECASVRAVRSASRNTGARVGCVSHCVAHAGRS